MVENIADFSEETWYCWANFTIESTIPIPAKSNKGKNIRKFALVDVSGFLYTVNPIATSARTNAAIFIDVSLSAGSIKMENMIGITTDILLARVVIVIPACLVDMPITKNITINKTPMITAAGMAVYADENDNLLVNELIIRPVIAATK